MCFLTICVYVVFAMAEVSAGIELPTSLCRGAFVATKLSGLITC